MRLFCKCPTLTLSLSRRERGRSDGMSFMAVLPITLDDIERAAKRIHAHVRRTPLLEASELAPGAHISLKLEFLQHTGSFKPRGAFNNLLSRKIPAAGVTAASGGNHGAATAFAAQALGHRARIFVPEISSPVKIAKIKACGADVVVKGATYYDARALCQEFARDSGALEIDAYDSFETISGQGTLAREWEAQAEKLDTVLIAVGGGGLIAGVAAWFGARVKVVGVEPEGSCALHAALAAGRIVDVEVKSVAADSLGARRAGEKVFAIARKNVDHVALVSDDAIRAAQKKLWDAFRIASEPGGATALAALLSRAYAPTRGERVGVLLCGGNVDLKSLSEL